MYKGKPSLVNPWDIVDTFFRDTEYYKSQHQIDSFDDLELVNKILRIDE